MIFLTKSTVSPNPPCSSFSPRRSALSYVTPSYPHQIFFTTPLSLLRAPEPPPAPFIRSVPTSECAHRFLLCTLMSAVIVSAGSLKVATHRSTFRSFENSGLRNSDTARFPRRVLRDTHPKLRHKNDHISPANKYLYYLPLKSPHWKKNTS